MSHSRTVLTIGLLFLLISLSACKSPLAPAATGTPTLTLTPTFTPTVTPVPLVLSVNGEGLTADEWQAALARYNQAQQALGKTVTADEAAQTAGQDLIDILLLSQGAVSEGKSLDDAALQARLDSLAGKIGGAEALSAWEAAHGYSEADFRRELRWQMQAAQMRDQIAGAVPPTAEQVHVKQILLYNSDKAQAALASLKGGGDFNTLAAQYDPLTQGELGWFPRGYLPEPAIEKAAFALQPGQFSEVIQTETGFHILYMVERDPAHLLTPAALQALQGKAVADWLTQQRSAGKITFTP